MLGADTLATELSIAKLIEQLADKDFKTREAAVKAIEALGPEALPSDIEVRTIGISRLARDLVGRLPEETLETLLSYVAGINAAIEDCGDNLPVEFDILEYRCEPWTVADTLALMKHFWWQLTGRLHLIAGPAPLADPTAAVRAALDAPLHYPPLRRALTPDDHVAVLVDEDLPHLARLLVPLLVPIELEVEDGTLNVSWP